MLLFELLTHEVPFADRPPLQAAVALGLQDLRPPLPPGTPRLIQELIVECWQRQPRMRPKFDAILGCLGDLSTSFTQEETAWINDPKGHPVYKTADGTDVPAAGSWARPVSRNVSSNDLREGMRGDDLILRVALP